MIKNAREAREIISKTKTIKVKDAVIGDIQDFSESKGYLAALEGPEIGILLLVKI